MKVLGLGTEGDSGAAVVEDGRLVAAVNEERISRMKLVAGFPAGALQEVLRLSDTAVGDLDAVIVAGERDLFVEGLRPFEGWFEHWRHSGGIGSLVKRIAGQLSRYRNRLPLLERGYYLLLSPSFIHRRRAIRRILHSDVGVSCPIHFIDHHFAHLTSAYYTSGFRDALVVSMDGGGDGRSTLVYAVRDGAWEYLHETSAFNSLGNYYAYVTHLCGFQPMKHEGKITGLAAYGEPKHLSLLRRFIDEDGGELSNRGGVVFREAIRELERQLPSGWKREDLAASIQRHFEELVPRYVGHWLRAAGFRDVAVAGGVFANVRVNQTVHELPEVDRIWVHPHMADGGLCGGAALAACVPGVLARTMASCRRPLPNVYLGAPLSEGDIDAALTSRGLSPESLSRPLEEEIAELLAQGYVVARASGAPPYGPRALGNRSILYQPTDRSVNDWLNQNLKRTEFMPFAPSVLYEEREACFENLEGAEHSAEFMTITFDCTPWMRENMKGVVHIDGTARPQLVKEEVNPEYHRIISAFHRRTGLPGIINTSFNMHEEPIVYSADDCVRAFLDGNLDYLALGTHLVKHPRGLSHELIPAGATQYAEGTSEL